jgi:hypothetical protein
MPIVSVHIPDSRAFRTTEPRIGLRRVSSTAESRQPPAKAMVQQQINILEGATM